MKTREKILATAQELLAQGGIAALSFDAIARALGVSKQAVLYWFPSKPDLLSEMFVGWVRAEARVAVAALQDSPAPPQAIARFVRAIAAFHLAELDRFRLMYLVPQTLKAANDPADRSVLPQVHAATAQLYSSLASHLPGPAETARHQAFAVHSATLGLVVMIGLAEGIGDPLRHPTNDLVSALVARLGGSD